MIRPIASVVVVAYKRKEYIIDALNSIRNQKGIDLEMIELIVVKYFKDEKIDKVINSFPVYKNIILEEDKVPNHFTVYNFVEGIKNVSSDIVFLLEDDDEFAEDKIASILNYIKKKNITYGAICNRQLIKTENKSNSKRGPYDSWFGVSCYTLVFNREKKEEFYETAKNVKVALDWLLYFFFKRDNSLYYVDRVLTYYRVHEKNQATNIKDIRKLIELYKNVLPDYEYMEKKFNQHLFRLTTYAKILLTTFTNKHYHIKLTEILKTNPIFLFHYFMLKLNKKKFLGEFILRRNKFLLS